MSEVEIFYNFSEFQKSLILDSLGPLILIKKTAFNNASLFFMIHLNTDPSFQPPKNRNYIGHVFK